MRTGLAVTAAVSTSLAMAACNRGSSSDTGATGGSSPIGVVLITKDSTNPFFVAMQKGAKADATKNNVKLTVASGKQEGDDQGQITAIEDAIARGDKGILITPMSTGVNAAIKKARDAGLYVIALDTPPDPAEHRRHHLRHRQPRGRQARRPVGRGHARRQGGHHRPARPVQRQDRLGRLQPRPGLPRGHGHRRRTTRRRTVTRPRPASTPAARAATTRSSATSRASGAEDGGRTAMENCLVQEPEHQRRLHDQRAGRRRRQRGAEGRRQDRRTIVSVDGGCAGVKPRQGRRHRRHRAAVPAEDGRRWAWRRSPRSPAAARSRRTSAGLDFFNTGVALVTDKPAEGVDSITSDRGRQDLLGQLTPMSLRPPSPLLPPSSLGGSSRPLQRVQHLLHCTLAEPAVPAPRHLPRLLHRDADVPHRQLDGHPPPADRGRRGPRRRADPHHPHRRHRPVGRRDHDPVDDGHGHTRHRRRACRACSPCSSASLLAWRPGALNGLLVTRVNLPPFIVTLGTLSIFTAIALLYSGGSSIQAGPPARAC